MSWHTYRPNCSFSLLPRLVEILNHIRYSLYNVQRYPGSGSIHDSSQDVDGYVYIPPKIQSNVPVIMCWCSNNTNEGTLSGHDTTHCANGMVIQIYVQHPLHQISPDEQKAGYGRYQEIVWKQIRNWRGQCRCDDLSITLIGRRFGDGGLSDRLIEIGIVPADSISGVLVER